MTVTDRTQSSFSHETQALNDCRVTNTSSNTLGSSPDRAMHRWDHRRLLSDVGHYPSGGTTRRAPLSAVVLPTSRHPSSAGDGVGLAARIAQTYGALLIVIRSSDACDEGLPSALAPSGRHRALVLDLTSTDGSPLPDLASERQTVATLHRSSDVGSKRMGPRTAR